MGMGRAFVALSGDASSPFWNPAASAAIDRTEVVAFHTSLFMDTKYDCLGVAYPLDLGVFSLSVGRLGSDNIIGRDENNIFTGEFSSSESQYGISYARAVSFGISGGITLKAANQRIGVMSGTGFGADLGFQYKPSFLDNLTLGLAFNDLLSPGIKLESVEDHYQTLSRFGIAYSRGLSDKISSLLSLELTKSSGRGTGFHSGVELTFYRQYALRAGLDKGRFSFGGGLVYKFVKLDYAFESLENLGGSHRISFGFTFGKSLSKGREEARARIVERERENWLNEIRSEQKRRLEQLIAAADSLKELGTYDDALGYYQRAFLLDSTSVKARIMSDSMIALVMEQAVLSAGDQKRQELIAGRIGSAMNDFRNGYYNESSAKLNLLSEIDPGNKSVIDLLNTVGETRAKEIGDRAKTAGRYEDEGDYLNALSEWNRLLALDRTNNEAAARIAELNKQIDADRLIANAVTALENRRYIDAADYLNRARSIRPESDTIKALMNEAMAKSAPPTTLEDIKTSSADWENYLLGLENYQSGDYSGALRIWENLRISYPNNSELDKNIDQARQRLAAESGR